jgi:SAM-dependent methyltransferase
LDLPKNAEILDAPCGYGRHSIGLAKKGFTVTGLDINSYHLKKAKIEAARNHAKVRFVKKNMIDLDYGDEFDAVINMFYSFGFFDRDKDNYKVLKNFFKALKPDGKFLMHTDVNIPRIISGKYKLNEIRNLKPGGKLKIEESYDAITKRINGAWILHKNGGEERKDYSVRVYTKDEFVKLCKSAGFKSCEVYSDWTGKPYDVRSEDMIIVATK